MTHTRICKGCSTPIDGTYLTALDAHWHPEHFCCTICQQPIADSDFFIHEDQPCHPTCYADSIAARCALCNKPLMGAYHTNYWDDLYCTDHADDHASCNYCGRLVADASKRDRRRSVENISCDTCASTAIETTDQAKQIVPDLITWLEGQGVRLPKKKFKIEVVDRADFLSRKGRHDPLGLTSSTKYTVNNRFDHAKVDSVSFLQGMPATLFAGVCVHELGHVWLLQKSVVELPILDEEGFCELLSYHYYTAQSNKIAHFYAQSIANNKNPVYGAGFRKLHKLESRVGFPQILKSLQRKKKLPL